MNDILGPRPDLSRNELQASFDAMRVQFQQRIAELENGADPERIATLTRQVTTLLDDMMTLQARYMTQQTQLRFMQAAIQGCVRSIDTLGRLVERLSGLDKKG